MLAALACLTLVALALVGLLYHQQRAHREAQAQWALERRELCNRIQRPEHVPAFMPEGYEIPELPPDEWNLVGTINRDPDAAREAE